jgi:hypothetical protein
MNNTEEEKPIGTLFDSINYYSTSDLEKFIDNLNYDQSIYCMMECCVYAQRRGILTLEEAEVISKSIRNLHKTEQ